MSIRFRALIAPALLAAGLMLLASAGVASADEQRGGCARALAGEAPASAASASVFAACGPTREGKPFQLLSVVDGDKGIVYVWSQARWNSAAGGAAIAQKLQGNGAHLRSCQAAVWQRLVCLTAQTQNDYSDAKRPVCVFTAGDPSGTIQAETDIASTIDQAGAERYTWVKSDQPTTFHSHCWTGDNSDVTLRIGNPAPPHGGAPSAGTAVIDGNNVVYTPNSGTETKDEFIVTATSSSGVKATAAIFVQRSSGANCQLLHKNDDGTLHAGRGETVPVSVACTQAAETQQAELKLDIAERPNAGQLSDNQFDKAQIPSTFDGLSQNQIQDLTWNLSRMSDASVDASTSSQGDKTVLVGAYVAPTSGTGRQDAKFKVTDQFGQAEEVNVPISVVEPSPICVAEDAQSNLLPAWDADGEALPVQPSEATLEVSCHLPAGIVPSSPIHIETASNHSSQGAELTSLGQGRFKYINRGAPLTANDSVGFHATYETSDRASFSAKVLPPATDSGDDNPRGTGGEDDGGGTLPKGGGNVGGTFNGTGGGA